MLPRPDSLPRNVTARAGAPRRWQAVTLALVALLALDGCSTPRAAGPVAAARAQAPAACADPGPHLAKQQSRLEPLLAPIVYTRHFYGPREAAGQPIDLQDTVWQPHRDLSDPASGFDGSVLLDPATGHALVLFKGMDRMSVEGGPLGALTDLVQVFGARFGGANAQVAVAERAYLQTLCDPQVRSVEVIGYSLGSQPANLLAVRWGATGTVFGNMGIAPERLAQGLTDAPAGTTRATVDARLTVLSLGGDVLVRMFGVGEEIGRRIDLPGSALGVLHDPEIYAHAASQVLAERSPDGQFDGWAPVNYARLRDGHPLQPRR
jgi:hypothetical protein